MTWTLHAILLPLWFVTGTLIGSFANVCIYRIPWQKSIFWPPSTCPKCLTAIAPRDNLPILSWLLLGRACRACREPIPARYPLVELTVGLLFACLYMADVWAEPRLIHAGALPAAVARLLYHSALVALLVIATFIDYDLQIIPDEVTLPGMALGVGVGALWPAIRPDPGRADSPVDGLIVGVIGLAVGAGVIYAVRALGYLIFRKEGMGLGDVTLVGMIGAFLGWQAVPLTLFLGAMLGLFHAAGRMVLILGDRLAGRTARDTAIPFGPYLSMAAFLLMVSWRWLWPGWAGPLFRTYGEVAGLLWNQFGPGAGDAGSY